MLDFFERYGHRLAPEPNSGCYLWTGTVIGNGYGNINRNGTTHYAHRAAYESRHGEGSATGFVVRHKCDVPCCCNPDHLLLGTKADNAMDAVERGLWRPAKGEKHPKALLTDKQVIEARRKARDGVPISEIAALYEISHSTADAMLRGRSWPHVPGAVSQFTRGVHPKTLSRETIAAVRDALKGSSPTEVSQTGLCSRSTAYKIKRDTL